jgi:plastocyanin
MSRCSLVAVCVLGSGLAASAASAATAQITLTNTPANMFSPQVVTIRKGDSVRWNNVAGTHNVFADDSSFTSGSVAAAPWNYTHQFDTVGTFGFYCQPHGGPSSGMFGTVVVVDTIELEHGSDQSQDQAGGSDSFRIGQKPYSSYEVVVDSLSGNPSLVLERTDAVGAALQSGAAVTPAINVSQSLRWENITTASVDNQLVRVSNSVCGTTCTSADTYRVRAYETTLAVPRFNQAGSQVTVLLLQNPSNDPIAGRSYFWSTAGALLNAGGTAFSLSAKSMLVLNVGTIVGTTGQTGTITISHDGRYGDLTGKAVALEPSTGFSFDTAAVVRAH